MIPVGVIRSPNRYAIVQVIIADKRVTVDYSVGKRYTEEVLLSTIRDQWIKSGYLVVVDSGYMNVLNRDLTLAAIVFIIEAMRRNEP